MMLVLAAAVGIVVGMVGTQVLSAQQAVVTRTPLLKGELMGIVGNEVTTPIVRMPQPKRGSETAGWLHPARTGCHVFDGGATL